MAGFFESINFNNKKNQKLQFKANHLRSDPKRLKQDVLALTTTSVPRDYTQKQGLEEAANYIHQQWVSNGFMVEEQNFEVSGKQYKNLITSYGDLSKPRIIVGAHYDVVYQQVGADDNASGVAGIIELARLLNTRRPKVNHRIDLVAFCLEEPPFYTSSQMGSGIYARELKKQKVDVKVMINLEMIGYYSNKPNSQDFPLAGLRLLYPTTGDFIAVVGDLNSFRLVSKIKKIMRKNSRIDVQALNAPLIVPGVDMSDHRNFWQVGYPAVMVTDTAFFRNPNYHTNQDTADTLNYELMAEVIEGIYAVIVENDNI